MNNDILNKINFYNERIDYISNDIEMLDKSKYDIKKDTKKVAVLLTILATITGVFGYAFDIINASNLLLAAGVLTVGDILLIKLVKSSFIEQNNLCEAKISDNLRKINLIEGEVSSLKKELVKEEDLTNNYNDEYNYNNNIVNMKEYKRVLKK